MFWQFYFNHGGVSPLPLYSSSIRYCPLIGWKLQYWPLIGQWSTTVYYSPSRESDPQPGQAGQGKTADTISRSHRLKSLSLIFQIIFLSALLIFFAVLVFFLLTYLLIFRSLRSSFTWWCYSQLSCSQGYSSQASFQHCVVTIMSKL